MSKKTNRINGDYLWFFVLLLSVIILATGFKLFRSIFSQAAYIETENYYFRAMPVYFQNQYLRIWDSRVYQGIIDIFYKNP